MTPTLTVIPTATPKTTTDNIDLQETRVLAIRGGNNTNRYEYLHRTTSSTKDHPTHPNIQPGCRTCDRNISDHTSHTTKSILKNNLPHNTAPQSPHKEQTVNPARAGNLRSPTMDMAPDFHHTESSTDRPTTEAVDPVNTARNTEPITSKTQTKKIKRSLLLQPFSPIETPVSTPSQTSQSANEVEDHRHTTTDATSIRSGSPSGDVNDPPTQDASHSHLIN